MDMLMQSAIFNWKLYHSHYTIWTPTLNALATVLLKAWKQLISLWKYLCIYELPLVTCRRRNRVYSISYSPFNSFVCKLV